MPVGVPLPMPVDMPIHYLSSSSDSTLSRHTSNRASGRSPTLDSTLSQPTTHVHRPVYTTDSALSRRTSISSDSTSSSPPLHVIPVGMPIRYSPPAPIGITILHPPPISISRPQSSILQPPIRHPRIYYPRIHHLLHGSDNMPSSYLSGGFYEMQISILEDFGGIEMEHHRADLLQRLDHVIEQLDRGVESFKRRNPEFNEDYLQRTKHQYRYIREILLEANMTSNQPYVSLNDHAAPATHSRPGCVQDLAQYFCGFLPRTLSLAGRVPGTHTPHFIHTSAVVSRPRLSIQLSILVLLVGYNFFLDDNMFIRYSAYLPISVLAENDSMILNRPVDEPDGYIRGRGRCTRIILNC